MTRLTFLLSLALLGGGATAATGYAAHPGPGLCVGSKAGCFSTIQAAVSSAHDGDTIAIGAGTFAGGITIDVSVNLRGAGSGETVIGGGGPVLTIGEEQAATEPTVSISGVTITGGFNDSHPDTAVTHGGGVDIPQGSFQARAGLGATVTIHDSVITANKVASKQLLPAGFCGPFDCSFASGGGISNAGTLTLIDTVVTDNQAGDPASITVVANGGGIAQSPQASLTVKHSSVTDNRTIGALPWGDAANAAGIDSRGRLTIEDSLVSGNSAQLSTDDPTDEGPGAIAGGIGIGAQATITHSTVNDNGVTASNVGGMALAVAGGIFDEGSLTLTDSTIAHNHISSSIPASSTDTAIAGGGGLTVIGTASIRDSRVVHNRVTANAPAGFAGAGGGGISNLGQTTIERTTVTANTVTVTGGAGFAHGGGIENTTLFGPPSLTLVDSVIAGNSLRAGTGIASQGGGVFTTAPITRSKTLMAGNKPDQCFGC